MNPIVHTQISWLVAQPLERRRDRLLVTAAGIVADLDGLGLLAGPEFYGRYHHVLTHGYVAAAAFTVAAALLATDRLRTAALAALAFHVHLLCDLAGSGPGWPIVYFWPTSLYELYWEGQWNLASWQNGVISLIVSLLCLAMAFPFRRTVVEIFSLKADALVVKVLWNRFRPGKRDAEGQPGNPS